MTKDNSFALKLLRNKIIAIFVLYLHILLLSKLSNLTTFGLKNIRQQIERVERELTAIFFFVSLKNVLLSLI